MAYRIRKFGLSALCACTLLAASAPTASAFPLGSAPLGISTAAVFPFGSAPLVLSGAVSIAADTLRENALLQAVKGWARTLSEQKAFAAWKQATPTVEALGPGTHGWLATFRLADGQPVGYMVVYAAEDGTYRLGEYGLGSQPLYDRTALVRSLVANGFIADAASPFEAEKLYLQPFAAVWKVKAGQESYWLDAKSCELLPLNDDSWNALLQAKSAIAVAASAVKLGTAKKLHLNETFDAFERLPWLMKEAPFDAADENALAKRLESGGHLRYVRQSFGDRMLYVLPVVGYERWSGGRLDLALDMNGSRFIPLGDLLAAGLIYN